MKGNCFLLSVAMLIAHGGIATAQESSVPYPVESGVHSNSEPTNVMAFARVVMVPGGDWMRVNFASAQLGERSFLRVTSLKDRAVQDLDARTLGHWRSTSAIFNGDTLLVELFVAPGEKGVYANIDKVVMAERPTAKWRAAGSLPKSLCGADNRVASGDDRVGRISGCTAWLVSNGAVLSAGHCGPVGGVFEVNVPASSAGGTPAASVPADQYPIDTSMRTSVDNGSGDDYTVFALLPNNTTGTRAHLRFGFFRMTKEAPAANATIRVTGFGVDNTPNGPVSNCCATDSNGNCTHADCNAQSRTLQTATGAYVGETGSGSDILHDYLTDTEPANSGSPIIWEANGWTIGIHTHGGCSSGGNAGTSFENTNLETLIQNFFGANTRYVDLSQPPNAPAQNGTIFQPFNAFPEAVTSVPSGGRVSMVTGNYTAAGGNTGTFGTGGKAFTLVAPVGTVTIGN